jgi:hypothetical protein
MSCDASDDISGLHCASEAPQDASKACARRPEERDVLKNELLFCNKSEVGRQSVKEALLRKALKKLGQAWEVKLLPREVSKGLGRGDGAPVLEEAVSMLAVALLVAVELALSVIVFVGVTTSVLSRFMLDSVAVGDTAFEESELEVGVASGATVEPNGSAFSCLR